MKTSMRSSCFPQLSLAVWSGFKSCRLGSLQSLVLSLYKYTDEIGAMVTDKNSGRWNAAISKMPEESSVSFLKTNKGKSLLLLNQSMFKCNKTMQTKKYWVCSEHGCCHSVHTSLNEEFFLATDDHEHVARLDIL